MRYWRAWALLLLITPLAAGAATSTLTLPEKPATEGETVIINWQPPAGTYLITVERVDTDGTVIGSETATFAVEALPSPPEPQVQGTSTTQVESSAKIQETIASIVPQAEVAAPVFATIDGLRQKGADVLDRGTEWAKEKATKPQGEVAGENTGDTGATEESGGIAGTALQLVATLLLYLFSILKFLVSNAGVFYPLLAIVFFYILWRLFKKMRRPKYG